MKTGRQAVVLLSGGLDSATALYLAREKGYRCLALSFDYGQRHKRELESAKKLAARAGVAWKLAKIALPWKGSSLLDAKLAVPLKGYASGTIPSTYVPGRNIIFLSFALSCAEAIGAEAIFIGAHAQDYSGYPDCRPEFFRAYRKVIRAGTRTGVQKKEIRIFTPLIHKGKSAIIKLAKRSGVPLELTWSCYQGGKFPCGKCDSCRFRAKGFKEAGLSDPLVNK
jgi:7-cyano-7-deazaguanine synthase